MIAHVKKPTQDLINGLYAVLGRPAPQLEMMRNIQIIIDASRITLAEVRVLPEDDEVPNV